MIEGLVAQQRDRVLVDGAVADVPGQLHVPLGEGGPGHEELCQIELVRIVAETLGDDPGIGLYQVPAVPADSDRRAILLSIENPAVPAGGDIDLGGADEEAAVDAA